jgi:hypothetical protein
MYFSCEPQTAGYIAHLSEVHLCNKDEKPGSVSVSARTVKFVSVFTKPLAVIQLTQDGNGLFKIICTLNDLAELVAHDAQEIHCLRNAAPVLLLSKRG